MRSLRSVALMQKSKQKIRRGEQGFILMDSREFEG